MFASPATAQPLPHVETELPLPDAGLVPGLAAEALGLDFIPLDLWLVAEPPEAHYLTAVDFLKHYPVH